MRRRSIVRHLLVLVTRNVVTPQKSVALNTMKLLSKYIGHPQSIYRKRRFASFLFIVTLLSVTSCAQAQRKQKIESSDLYIIIQNKKFGFIDSQGRIVVKPQFQWARRFKEGLAAVLIVDKDAYKTAFIDTSGRIVIKPFDGSPTEAGFSSGVALVLENINYFYIDKTGKQIGEFYQNAEDCSEGLCAVRMGSLGPGLWGYINTSGKVVIKGQYDWAHKFSEGLASVCIMRGHPYMKNGAIEVDASCGYIDKTGRAITELKFEKAWDFKDGMAEVRLDGKWGYIDKTGRLAIKPQFDETSAFQNGLAKVKVGDKWGYIDKIDHIVIPPQFEYADDFYEDRAAVRNDGKSFYIDRMGKMVLSIPFDSSGRFRNGAAVFRLNGKMGLINKAGITIIEPQFTSLEMVSDELIFIEDEDKGIGYIDYAGKFVWKPSY